MCNVFFRISYFLGHPNIHYIRKFSFGPEHILIRCIDTIVHFLAKVLIWAIVPFSDTVLFTVEVHSSVPVHFSVPVRFSVEVISITSNLLTLGFPFLQFIHDILIIYSVLSQSELGIILLHIDSKRTKVFEHRKSTCDNCCIYRLNT